MPALSPSGARTTVRYNLSLVRAPIRDLGCEQDAQVDIAVMTRMAARDASAVAELYDRHSRLLFGLILRILGQRSDAEEVLQEVFMAVWNKSDTYNVALGPPVAWLVRIARNRALDRLRANAVRVRTAESATEPTHVDSPEVAAVSKERHQTVVRALSALPGIQRELIEQAYFLGLTQSELAKRHKLPLGTVKTRIRTGMLALRQSLSQMQTS